MQQPQDSFNRIKNNASKTYGLVRHFFDMIAIGEWRSGTKLPSIRQIEKDISVNRQTILKAFKILAEFGLILHRPNSGYFVSGPDDGHDNTIDRFEQENLYDKICAEIVSSTDLLPLVSLRLLATIAERRMSEKPVIVFIECSKSQAEDHVKEISDRLQLPIMPISLDELDGKPNRVPASAKIVLTTSFHSKELAFLANPERKVVSLPVQISAKLISDINMSKKNIIFLESNAEQAHRTFNDASWMMGIDNPQVKIVSRLTKNLQEHFEKSDKSITDTIYVVPQKQWETLDPELKMSDFVLPLRCELSETSWPIILAALKIPSGMNRSSLTHP